MYTEILCFVKALCNKEKEKCFSSQVIVMFTFIFIQGVSRFYVVGGGGLQTCSHMNVKAKGLPEEHYIVTG